MPHAYLTGAVAVAVAQSESWTLVRFSSWRNLLLAAAVTAALDN